MSSIQGGGQLKTASFAVIEQGGKNAGRIEIGETQRAKGVFYPVTIPRKACSASTVLLHETGRRRSYAPIADKAISAQDQNGSHVVDFFGASRPGGWVAPAAAGRAA